MAEKFEFKLYGIFKGWFNELTPFEKTNVPKSAVLIFFWLDNLLFT